MAPKRPRGCIPWVSEGCTSGLRRSLAGPLLPPPPGRIMTVSAVDVIAPEGHPMRTPSALLLALCLPWPAPANTPEFRPDPRSVQRYGPP